MKKIMENQLVCYLVGVGLGLIVGWCVCDLVKDPEIVTQTVTEIRYVERQADGWYNIELTGDRDTDIRYMIDFQGVTEQ